MAMMVADRVFVDTNVLVHAAVAEATLHTEASQQLEAYNQAGVEIWISRQVYCVN